MDALTHAIEGYITKGAWELSDMFERDKKRSFRLTKESWDKWRTGKDKFRGWLSTLLSPWL